ncbi:hypothetical protein C8R47DRAFT_280823 [Mycena vitilis]|nr:hypothetical protein C8R47DRAFT_280823 [Mycena vitilis]
MSAPPIPVPGSKKRRLQGACDICRSKKSMWSSYGLSRARCSDPIITVKCDSAKMPDNICSNCIGKRYPSLNIAESEPRNIQPSPRSVIFSV